MEERIEMLALSYPLDDLCAENDVDPAIVVTWLVDEGYVKLEDYFEEDDEG